MSLLYNTLRHEVLRERSGAGHEAACHAVSESVFLSGQPEKRRLQPSLLGYSLLP
ncbi:MAG: hypothetical protein KIG22_07640 [Oxalobacter sp.]|uniref:hypothetical protein n=1 Tax=Oxalobacter paeniformigenes TaxID=2946594 RepID=UPI0022AF5515|nr:hypothetical protein [Oxalobacter paeniformigenes]MBS7405782.1 hypothetical protein [Oxalobacter sp.]MCZ4052886.1 hypothetical protein [Oxalobacter paeniformigenes]